MEKEAGRIGRLVRKAMHGSCDAFGELIHIYQDYLYRTAFVYMKNEDAALDVVQDCILKAYESIKNLRKPEYFKTWITRILINCANQYFNKNRRIIHSDIPQEAEAAADISIEERCDLYHAIDQLPERYRTVVILRYYNDLKISEIAEIMEIPEGSVKAYLYRAKRELRVYLKEGYAYEE